MSDISAKISQSGLLKGSSSSQQEVVASKVEVNTAGINLGDLSDVVITSPADGSYVVYQSSSNTFLDDQTITKTADGVDVTGLVTAKVGSYGTKLSYSNSNQSGILDTYGNHNLEFRTNNDRAMNIAANGDISFYEDTGTTPKLFWDASAERLGIGTTSPSAALDVVGDIDVTGTITFDGGTTSADLNFGDGDKAVFGASGNLKIYFDGNHSYVYDTGAGDLRVRGNNLYLQNDTGGNYLSAINGGATTLFHNGNTKFATTANGVSVSGRAEAGEFRSDIFRGSTYASGSYLDFDDDETRGSSEATTLESIAAMNLKFDNNANDGQKFRIFGNTDGTDKAAFTIDDSLNVGINTETPTSLLTVEGDIRQTSGDLLYQGGGNWDLKHLADNQNILFHTSVGGSTTEKMRIKSDGTVVVTDGNVGIGTDDPNRKLHVKGSGNTVAIKVESTDTSQASLDMQNSAGWFRFITNDGVLRIYDQANNAERWRISNSGNVGINQTNPAQRLHVSGHQLFENNNELRWKDSGGVERTALWMDASNNVNLGASSNAKLRFINGPTYAEKMVILPNGNVGIGIGDPTEKLDVSGNVKATQFKGDLLGTINTATTAATQSASDNSTKVATTAYVTTAVAAGVSDLVGGAGSALDTLNELAAALGDDANFATTTSTALTNRLRVDVNNQSLNATQKTNALTNLGVSTFGASLIDDADAAAARTTLGLGSAATTAATAYATAAQGSLAASALQSGDVLSTLTVTGPLVQNQIAGNIFEVIAPDTGDAVDPIISLHRNSASPAANDKLGIIKFNGEDSAGNKTEYASIQANITSPTSGAEYGSLAFNIMNNGTSEAPVMTLFESGLRLANDNDLLLSANGNIQFTGDTGLSTVTTLYCVTPTSNRSINLPDASGTVITSGNTSDLGTLTSLTVDNIAINGTTIGHTSDTDILTFSASEPKLTVSAAAMEIVDASDTATAGPTLSLYKNRANPASGDQLGRILFVGENDADEKTYYGQLTCEIGGAGVDDGGEQAEFKFHVTDGTPNGTDNNADDLTEDYTTIGPSDQVPLKINSAGVTVNGADGLILGAGKNIVFTGANNYYGDGAYQNYLRQEEPSQASVNANDTHSYQMLPTGSGVIMRSRGSDRVLDENIDKSTEVITFGSAHGLRTGDPVVYNDAKGTPIQINDGTNRAVDSARFFAIVTSTTAIKLATTVANALAGTALDIVNDGADNQSFLFPNQMDNPIQMRDQVFELGHKTTTERDALTAETAFNGAILYNDTTNQVNAYVNNAWKAVATTNAESFTGGMTVTGGLQASPKTIFYDSTSPLTIVPSTHAGTKIINGKPAGVGAGPCTYNFPVPAAANIGETYTIVNFGVENITLTCSAGGGNDFRSLVLGTGAANRTTIVIPGGAAVEVITTNHEFIGQLQYLVFGSGVI